MRNISIMQTFCNSFLKNSTPILGSGILLFTQQIAAQSQAEHPNVLILFSDQHNKKVMGFEGHPDVITPNLDKLAKESVVFDRAYCTTWSQATVITRDYKFGIMLDPTDYARKFDYRSFGDQFFVRKSDSLEINNQINNAAYKSETEKLRNYYQNFTFKIPDTGKTEVIRNIGKSK